jgi:hypothetical protein
VQVVERLGFGNRNNIKKPRLKTKEAGCCFELSTLSYEIA